MCTQDGGGAERIVQIRALLVAQLRDAAFVARVHRAAEAVARGRYGSGVARDVVADVVGDTYSGTLHWNPERAPLWMHLMSEVKRRVGRARRIAARHRLLDDEDPRIDASEDTNDDAREQVDPADIFDEVHRRAAGDTDVQQLLSFYLQGTTRKAHILRLGMSDTTYRNARRRLRRLAVAALKVARHQ